MAIWERLRDGPLVDGMATPAATALLARFARERQPYAEALGPPPPPIDGLRRRRFAGAVACAAGGAGALRVLQALEAGGYGAPHRRPTTPKRDAAALALAYLLAEKLAEPPRAEGVAVDAAMVAGAAAVPWRRCIQTHGAIDFPARARRVLGQLSDAPGLAGWRAQLDAAVAADGARAPNAAMAGEPYRAPIEVVLRNLGG